MATTPPRRYGYLDLLRGVHAKLQPRTYLEVGISSGHSLELSRARSVGIDPDYSITQPVAAPIRLARQTSDAYFAGTDPKEWLGGPIDLAFIDGLHQFEFALRDFINVEEHCHWASVVVFDDMLPRNIDEAARERHTDAWAGDVFWVGDILKAYRPDLTVLLIDTKPTGTAVVLGLDPDSTVLRDHYEEIIAKYLHEDPQPVPERILKRVDARPPAEILDSPVWGTLKRGRRPFHGRERGLREIAAALEAPREYRRLRRALRQRANRLVRDGRRRINAVLSKS